MLKSLFSGFLNTDSPVAKCYELLDTYQKGLSKKIAQYVMTGEGPEVINTLSSLSQEQIREAGVWKIGNYYSYNYSKKRQKEIEVVSKAFINIYGSTLLLDPAACFRWGAVRSQCIDISQETTHYKIATADWFSAIFIDISSIYPLNKIGDLYTVQWLIDLVNYNEGDDKVWLHVLLERDTWSRALIDFLDKLLYKTDLRKVFSHSENLKYIEKLHVTGRLTIAKDLDKYDSIDDAISLVILLLTDSSKQVREQASPLVSKLEQNHFHETIKSTFHSYATARRKELARLIAIYGDDNAVDLLEELAISEKAKSVNDAIENVIANKQASQNHSNAQLKLPDYISPTDGLAVPEELVTQLIRGFSSYLEKCKRNAEYEKENSIKNQYKATWQQKKYQDVKSITEKELKAGLHYLATGEDKPHRLVLNAIADIKLYKEPQFALNYIVRQIKEKRNIDLKWGYFPDWLRLHPKELTDLRQLAEVLEKNEIDKREIAEWILYRNWGSDGLPDTGEALIWPFFIENEEYLQEAFGLKPAQDKNSYYSFELTSAIQVLEQLEVIPEQYLQVIYQHALSASKTYGPLARKTLTQYGVVEERVISTLSSSKQDERTVAANWIAELGLKKALPELKKAMKKEKREVVKAALLGAMHRLGNNIDVYLSPKVLLEEAQSGLKKAIPKNLNWFPFSSLPALKWKSGKKVDAEIIKWWIVLAAKLKQPEGNPLFDLYLDRLDETSKQTLGMFLLQLFISQDTQCPADEVADEYANSNKQNTYDYWQKYANYEWGAEYKDKTIEDAYQVLFRQKKAEYLGSAIGEKGILALAYHVNAADAVQIVSRYMKDHFIRRHQIEAILSALANNNDPIVIQLLLSVARRHRTNSVQERAKLLVEEIASRNGWTQDELADRTIPTAGFESNGTQLLELGSRQLIIKLDSNLKPVIENEQGRILKTLPAARQDDDPEQVKQAKKDFSSSKKELKQVLDLQGKRLYEAMCIERQWIFSEWNQYLLEHPIMRHLVQRLVWMVEDGEQRVWVRPTAELELIDLEDEDYEFSDNAKISVAHISQLSAEEGKSWLKNFKEEKVKPLFEQFNQPSHTITDKNVKSLNYHKGWMTDSFTLRGILSKRGYQRGEAEDGGFFTHYYKDFSTLNLRVVIEFSGNCVPEENCVAILYELAFVDGKNRGWLNEDDYKQLKDIPGSLVSEAMLDYEAVAAKANYDKDWENKMPW